MYSGKIKEIEEKSKMTQLQFEQQCPIQNLKIVIKTTETDSMDAFYVVQRGTSDTSYMTFVIMNDELIVGLRENLTRTQAVGYYFDQLIEDCLDSDQTVREELCKIVGRSFI